MADEILNVADDPARSDFEQCAQRPGNRDFSRDERDDDVGRAIGRCLDSVPGADHLKAQADLIETLGPDPDTVAAIVVLVCLSSTNLGSGRAVWCSWALAHLVTGVLKSDLRELRARPRASCREEKLRVRRRLLGVTAD